MATPTSWTARAVEQATDAQAPDAAPRRDVVMDLEMTGLDPAQGHRVTEVAFLERIDGRLTGRALHRYVDPEREIPAEVLTITPGMDQRVRGQAKFAEIAQEVRDFIGTDPLIHHCRPYDADPSITTDMAFLNAELARAGVDPVPQAQVINTRPWAQQALFGGDFKQARLDNILDHYGVDRSRREAEGHGALLDTELYAEIVEPLRRDHAAWQAGQALTASAPDADVTPRRQAPKPV